MLLANGSIGKSNHMHASMNAQLAMHLRRSERHERSSHRDKDKERERRSDRHERESRRDGDRDRDRDRHRHRHRERDGDRGSRHDRHRDDGRSERPRIQDRLRERSPREEMPTVRGRGSLQGRAAAREAPQPAKPLVRFGIQCDTLLAGLSHSLEYHNSPQLSAQKLAYMRNVFDKAATCTTCLSSLIVTVLC